MVGLGALWDRSAELPEREAMRPHTANGSAVDRDEDPTVTILQTGTHPYPAAVVVDDNLVPEGGLKGARLLRHRTKPTAVAASAGTGCGRLYEVDHLVSLELGGSNDQKNLWPEPYDPRPGAHEKDLAENHLHRAVCSGEMTLSEAQRAIASDWIAVYRAMTSAQRGRAAKRR